jgi:hypothetical protein
MSEQPKDGGPAFPVLTDMSGGEAYYLATPGMSLRDWFAGQALPSLVATESENNRSWQDGSRHIAAAAYAISDALLAAREVPHDR